MLALIVSLLHPKADKADDFRYFKIFVIRKCETLFKSQVDYYISIYVSLAHIFKLNRNTDSGCYLQLLCTKLSWQFFIIFTLF